MSRPKALDLFCGAGGAAVGLHRAGFDVVGVDIDPQPNFPFEFHQADAMNFDLSGGFDLIWSSPPCQLYTNLHKMNQAMGNAKSHPDLVEPIRSRLVSSGTNYVIENVVGAPLIDPIKICGSSFGLRIRRHRLFESNMAFWGTPCAHYWQKPDLPGLHRLQKHSTVVGVYGGLRGSGDYHAKRSNAMRIDWMTARELTQAIPPAYSEYIGRQVLAHVQVASE